MKLKDLSINQKGTVVGYLKGNCQFQQRLIAFGLVPGVSFTVVRKAPLGDPIQIKVLGSNIALRKMEADVLELSAI